MGYYKSDVRLHLEKEHGFNFYVLELEGFFLAGKYVEDTLWFFELDGVYHKIKFNTKKWPGWGYRAIKRLPAKAEKHDRNEYPMKMLSVLHFLGVLLNDREKALLSM